MLPTSELREVLRIRTDIVKENSPPGCSSAINVPSATRSPLPMKPMSAPPTGGLRQLRLVSNILTISLRPLILSPSPPSLKRDLLHCLPSRPALHLAFYPVSSFVIHQLPSSIDEYNPTVDHIFNASIPRSPSVSSTTSFSRNSSVCQLISPQS